MDPVRMGHHWCSYFVPNHYDDVIMGAMSSQITSLTIVYSIVYSGTVQRKYQSSASLAFVWGIHRGPVNSPHKGPVMREMFPFDDVIMITDIFCRFWFMLYHAYIRCSHWHGELRPTKASDAELWCFFYLRLNKRLSKISWGWWSEAPSCSL